MTNALPIFFHLQKMYKICNLKKKQNKLVHELKTATRIYGANALHSCCLAQFNLIKSNFYETLSKRRKIINPKT